MNKVRIAQLQDLPLIKIYINGEEISAYSDLSKIVKLSFEKFANKILEVLDNELYDDYEIDFEATAFQYYVLKSCICKSHFCKAVNLSRKYTNGSLSQKIRSLRTLCRKKNIEINETESLNIFSEVKLCTLENSNNVLLCDRNNAKISVVNDISSAVFGAIYHIGKEYGIRNYDDKIVTTVPGQDVDSFEEFIEYYYILRPEYIFLVDKLSNVSFSEKEKLEYEYIITDCATFYIGDVPSEIDVGSPVKLDFFSFPNNYFSVRSSQPNIISANNTSVVGLMQGICAIEIIDKNGNVKKSFQIKSTEHLYLKEIRLLPQFKFLIENEVSRINLIPIPNNAEDISSVIWESSNTSVAQIDCVGNITAINCGITRITARGKVAQTSFDVRVCPKLQSISLMPSRMRLRNNQQGEVRCTVFPQNYITESLQWQNDNNTIASFKPSSDGASCVIYSSKDKIGRGNIRVIDKYSGLSAVCPLEVSSNLSRIEIFAVVMIILGMFVPFFQVVSFGLGFYGNKRIADNKPLVSKKLCIVSMITAVIAALIWIGVLISSI